MESKENERLLLMIPGPTIVDPKVLRAMSKPVTPHREKEFSEMFLEQAERMKQIFKTKNDLFLLAGSGTAAMDAAISNTIKPGEKVLCIVSGKFSERFTEIVKCYGGEAIELNFEWGKEIDVNKVKKVLEENDDIKAVTVVHNETSTG
ncbi:MAG: alanine--glyoxylate aminotransferase family protein, partial [Methanomicrobia archaeon]|nr:alanine--glyoxylate aminotransferase family protein [Methanomicrobia archaeon]